MPDYVVEDLGLVPAPRHHYSTLFVLLDGVELYQRPALVIHPRVRADSVLYVMANDVFHYGRAGVLYFEPSFALSDFVVNDVRRVPVENENSHGLRLVNDVVLNRAGEWPVKYHTLIAFRNYTVLQYNAGLFCPVYEDTDPSVLFDAALSDYDLAPLAEDSNSPRRSNYL